MPLSLCKRTMPFRGGWTALWATVFGLVCSNFSRAQPPLPPVNVSPVVEQSVAAGHTFVGTVMPLRKSTVGSPIDGRVMDFFVNEGEAVRAGQPVAQLRTKTLELELAAARAELKFRQEELRELENGCPEEIEQAEARLKSLEPVRRQGQIEDERTRSLLIATRSAAKSSRTWLPTQNKLCRLTRSQVGLSHDPGRAARGDNCPSPGLCGHQQEVVARLEDIIDKHTIVAV